MFLRIHHAEMKLCSVHRLKESSSDELLKKTFESSTFRVNTKLMNNLMLCVHEMKGEVVMKMNWIEKKILEINFGLLYKEIFFSFTKIFYFIL